MTQTLTVDAVYSTPTFTDDFSALSVLRFDGSHWPPLAGPGRWALCNYYGWPTSVQGAGCRFDPNDAQSFEDGAVTVDANGLLLTAQLTATLSAPDRAAMVSPQQQWRAGMVAQNPTFAQTYGYFEWVVHLPKGRGLWPACWLLPIYHNPPELDALEMLGNDPTTIYCTPHSAIAADQSKCICQPVKVADMSLQFHKVGVLWTESQISWFLDDAPIDQQPTPSDMTGPMYMIASMGVGGPGSWPGPSDATTPNPSVMRVRRMSSYAIGSWGSALIPTTSPVGD